jgi:hypothetical protein
MPVSLPRAPPHTIRPAQETGDGQPAERQEPRHQPRALPRPRRIDAQRGDKLAIVATSRPRTARSRAGAPSGKAALNAAR